MHSSQDASVQTQYPVEPGSAGVRLPVAPVVIGRAAIVATETLVRTARQRRAAFPAHSLHNKLFDYVYANLLCRRAGMAIVTQFFRICFRFWKQQIVS